jgi:hypothetical protein
LAPSFPITPAQVQPATFAFGQRSAIAASKASKS